MIKIYFEEELEILKEDSQNPLAERDFYEARESYEKFLADEIFENFKRILNGKKTLLRLMSIEKLGAREGVVGFCRFNQKLQLAECQVSFSHKDFVQTICHELTHAIAKHEGWYNSGLDAELQEEWNDMDRRYALKEDEWLSCAIVQYLFREEEDRELWMETHPETTAFFKSLGF